MGYKKLSSFVLVFLFALLALPALANEVEVETDVSVEAGMTPPPMPPKPPKTNAEMKANLEAKKAEMEARRAEMETKKAEMEAKRASSTQHREDMREKMLERKASTTERIQDRKASSTARRIEFQKNIAKRQVEHVTKVMLATIERLEKIILRIESRIEKVKGEGNDTSEAEGFVADAKQNLVDAEASVNAFVGIELSSDKAQENFEEIRNAAAEAREHIRMARENLMNAIRSLGSLKAKVEADSSATE